MAATIAYQPIRLMNVGPNAENDAIISYYPLANGQTPIEGDILTISSGQLSKAAANAAAIAGMAMFASTNIYHAFSGAGTGLNFGPDQTGTALIPATNQYMGLVQFDNNMEVEINLSQATTLATSLIGTQVGLGYDAGSGFFFADPAAGNKIATIRMIPGGPDAPANRLGLSNGVIGDSGGRIVIQFLASALQV